MKCQVCGKEVIETILLDDGFRWCADCIDRLIADLEKEVTELEEELKSEEGK